MTARYNNVEMVNLLVLKWARIINATSKLGL